MAIGRALAAAILTIGLVVTGTARAQQSGARSDERRDETMQNLMDHLAAHHHGKVSLYARAVRTGQTVAIDPDRPVNTASVIKVAIMLEAMYQVKEGRVSFNDDLTLRKEDQVSGSGVLLLYHTPATVNFETAIVLMITQSDNTATNLVIDVLTADAVNARLQSLGLTETRLMRKILGGGDSEEGKKPENKKYGLGRATPHEMVTLMEKLERGEIVSPEASKEMLALMKREDPTLGIWRGVLGIPKATKSGALDRLRSNVGLIYHPRGRIALAITCDDMPQTQWNADNPAFLLMSRVSEIVIDGLGK